MLWVQRGVNRCFVFVGGSAEGADAGWAFVGWHEGEEFTEEPAFII